ncbi:MAG: tyrosine recombinase [Paracoccaceae bacterium]
MKSLDNLSSDFLLSLVTEKNMSLNTASSYASDLNIFFTFIKQQNLSMETVRKTDIGNFFHTQRERGFSDNTVSRRLSTMKQFFKFLVRESLVDRNPCEDIKNFKKTKKIPGFLSEKEVIRILDSARSVGKNNVERARNKALIEILYASGMRVSELVSLPKSVFIGSPELILIRGKGNKERMVPISKIALSAVKKYLLEMKKTNIELYKSDFLFPSRSKKGHLNREKFFLIIKEIANNAGLNAQYVSPHKIRHAFASHLLSNGADLRVIQTLLGHKNLSTTEIYTHILDEKIIKSVQENHPFAKKNFKSF